MGIIGAYSRGRGRNFQVNLSIQRAEIVARSANIVYTLQYVELASNLADPISHGELGPAGLHLPLCFPVPPELSPHLYHVVP